MQVNAIKLNNGLLTFNDYRISNGPLEGVNSKIKTFQKKAYGFRDLLFFKLKIYALHETKYALIGLTTFFLVFA